LTWILIFFRFARASARQTEKAFAGKYVNDRPAPQPAHDHCSSAFCGPGRRRGRDIVGRDLGRRLGKGRWGADHITSDKVIGVFRGGDYPDIQRSRVSADGRTLIFAWAGGDGTLQRAGERDATFTLHERGKPERSFAVHRE
jgi:hypothetical protein